MIDEKKKWPNIAAQQIKIYAVFVGFSAILDHKDDFAIYRNVYNIYR